MSDEVFIELCETGSLQQIVDAIEDGANVHARDTRNRTPITTAARNNPNPAVITTLIKAGADVETEDGRMTPLMWAAWRNPNPEVITALVNAGADVNASQSFGWTPLMHAVSGNSNPEVISTLVKAGADVNVKDRGEKWQFPWAAAINLDPENQRMTAGGKTLLMLAVWDSHNPEVIPALVKAAVDVNAKDEDGQTALMFAAGVPHPEMVTALVNVGADVNAKEKYGNTALMFAAREKSNAKTITALTKAGADVNAADKDGMTALMFAAAQGSPDLKMVTALVNAGADVNAREKYGNTALILAARANSNPNVMTALTKAGADVNAMDSPNGWTALMTAIRERRNPNPKVIRNLVKAGADVNGRTKFGGSTPLILAAEGFAPKVITLLLDLGADPKAKDSSGKMAIDHARKNKNLKNTDVLKKLEEISR